MRIVMIGAGYVGLVSGAYLGDFGREVVRVDNHQEKVASPLAGRVPIYEPSLSTALPRIESYHAASLSL